MTEYVYKLKNGKLVSAYADEKGNISITKEALEIMVNSWNDGYQKGSKDGYNQALDDVTKEFKEYCGRQEYLIQRELWEILNKLKK